ncbi:hypothetical protein JCM24511_07807 [Saitozyma sp. JCM 24511]|nr:hypothetical protein JCM24511_07807 [Saitozyma sp. JCM 24511]
MSKQFELSVDEFDQSARQRVRKILPFEESHEEAEQNEQMREDWVVSVIDFGPVRLSLWT